MDSVGERSIKGATEPNVEHDWMVSAGALHFECRVYAPEVLGSKVTGLHHDNLESGHFGALKTAELILLLDDFVKDVKMYCIR